MGCYTDFTIYLVGYTLSSIAITISDFGYCIKYSNTLTV